jgi:hypothetical protein
MWDISALNYMDTNSGTSVPYQVYYMQTLSNLQSSTDMVHWSNYTLVSWVSAAGEESIITDGNGQPMVTNYFAVSAGAPAFPFVIWVHSQPSKFVRYLTQ